MQIVSTSSNVVSKLIFSKLKMKLIAFLIVFLCAAVTAEQFSVRNIILSMPFEEIEKNINQYASNIQCVRGVVDKVLAENDVNSDAWEEIKAKAANLAGIDMKKCMEINDPEEHMK